MLAPVTVRETVLRELISVSEAPTATILGTHSGFTLQFRVGSAEKVLATSKGSIRLFASLDTASTFVKDLGIARFLVDMSGFQPGRLRPPRPDRAEAMRHTRTKLRQQELELRS